MVGSTTKETNYQETASDRKPTDNAHGSRKYFVEFNDKKTVAGKIQLYKEKLQEIDAPENVKTMKLEPQTNSKETGTSRKVED